jgi:hypothetical protein
MKHLAGAFAAAALLAFTLPASAQLYPTSPSPQPMYYSGLAPEMMDDGCCTDFPTHTPSDFVADQLNRQVLDYNAGLRATPP